MAQQFCWANFNLSAILRHGQSKPCCSGAAFPGIKKAAARLDRDLLKIVCLWPPNHTAAQAEPGGRYFMPFIAPDLAPFLEPLADFFAIAFLLAAFLTAVALAGLAHAYTQRGYPCLR